MTDSNIDSNTDANTDANAGRNTDLRPEEMPRSLSGEYASFIRGRLHVPVPPPVLGTPVPYTPTTYARTWAPTAAEQAAEHERLHRARADHPAPVQRSRVASLSTTCTRAGRLKSVELGWPDGRRPEPPRALSAALKRVIDLDISIRVTHARGYEITATGDPKRVPIWEARTPSPEDPRVRVQVGAHPPAPVDSWVLRLTWDCPLRLVMIGTWTDATPDTFHVWRPGQGVLTVADLSTWTAVLSAVATGACVEAAVETGLEAAATAKREAAQRRAARS